MDAKSIQKLISSDGARVAKIANTHVFFADVPNMHITDLIAKAASKSAHEGIALSSEIVVLLEGDPEVGGSCAPANHAPPQ